MPLQNWATAWIAKSKDPGILQFAETMKRGHQAVIVTATEAISGPVSCGFACEKTDVEKPTEQISIP